MQYIEVTGIRVYGFHGCMPTEKHSGTPFTIDVTLWGNFSKAMQSDQLEDAADYVTISNIAIEEAKKPSKLIEVVAGRIMNRLSDSFPIAEKFRVKITKHRAPIQQDVAEVAFVFEK